VSKTFPPILIYGPDSRRGTGGNFLLHASISPDDDDAALAKLNRLLAGHDSALTATIGEHTYTIKKGIAHHD
jgi:hypothetical protein